MVKSCSRASGDDTVNLVFPALVVAALSPPVLPDLQTRLSCPSLNASSVFSLRHVRLVFRIGQIRCRRAISASTSFRKCNRNRLYSPALDDFQQRRFKFAVFGGLNELHKEFFASEIRIPFTFPLVQVVCNALLSSSLNQTSSCDLLSNNNNILSVVEKSDEQFMAIHGVTHKRN